MKKITLILAVVLISTSSFSQGIEEITFAVAEQTSWEDRVDEDIVRNILNSNPVINGEVHAVYVDMSMALLVVRHYFINI